MTFLHALKDELGILFKYRGILLVLIGAPLFYSLFYPLPYQEAQVREVALWVTDADRTQASRHLIDRLDATPSLSVVQVSSDEASLSDALHQGRAQAYIRLPEDMQADLERGEAVTVSYGAAAGNFLVYGTAARALAETIRAESDDWARRHLYETVDNAVQAEARAEPLQLALTPLFNSDRSYLQYLVPGVYLFLVQQVMMLAVGMHWGVQTETGRRPEPVGGFLAQTVIYGLHGLILVIALFKWGLPFQSVWPALTSADLVAYGLPFVLSSVWAGMIVSRFMTRLESPLVWLLPLSVPLLLLTGISWPLFAMADWLRPLSVLVPATLGSQALLGKAFMGAEPELWPLWAMAGLYGGLAMALRFGAARDNAPAPRPSTAGTPA